MVKVIKLAPNLKEALERVDCLGFDDAMQAFHAILTHDNFGDRWDFSQNDKDQAVKDYILILGHRDKVLGIE